MADIKLPKVSQYVKNVGKSVAFAAINGITDNTEGIKEFTEENKEVFSKLYSSAKNYRDTLKQAKSSLEKTNIFKAVDYGIKNIIDDIKTGNLYNDRSYDISETALGLDDDSLGLDFDYETTSDSRSSEEKLADSFDRAIESAATSQSTVIAKSTDLVIKTSKASTAYIGAQIDRATATLHSGIGAVYSAIDKTNQFLNGPMLAHLENSRSYYDNSLKIMQEQQAMMKEMLDMQRNLYKAKEKEYQTTRLEKSMNSSGSVNLKGYMDVIKRNISNIMDDTGLSMFDLTGESGMNPLMLFAAAPMKMIMDNAVQKILPKNLKRNLGSLDRGLTTLFSQFISKMNYAKNDYIDDHPVLELLSKVFGIDIKKKDRINTSNYNKGPVPFDGITRQTIVEVIPGYLARIEASLTGSGERYYDNQRGTWKSAMQIHKEFEEETIRSISNANMELRYDLMKMTQDMNAGARKEFEESILPAMMKKIYEDFGDFRPDLVRVKDSKTGKYKYRSSERSEAWQEYGFPDKETFDRIFDYITPETLRNLASRNMSAIESNARVLEEHENNGGIYTKLFNGTFDSTGSGNTNKKNPSKFVFKNGLLNILSSNTDEQGNNIFYYLRNILSAITDRNNRRRGRKNNRPNRPSNGPNGPTTGGSPSGSAREPETESEGDPGSFNGDWDSVWEDIDRKNEEEQRKADNKNRTSNWFKDRLDRSPIGRFFNKISSGATGLLAAPFDFANKLIEKANNNMMTMIFGEKFNKEIGDYRDRNGNEITNVFQFIIDKIDRSFRELVDNLKDAVKNTFDRYIKPIVDKYVKPVWDKYGKPVIDEIKNFGRKAGRRARRAVSNTFGRAYRNARSRRRDNDGYEYDGDMFTQASDTVASGGVASADEFEGNVGSSDDDGYEYVNSMFGESARGRIVTKRGLTMISPGEIIIPASFNKKDQDKMLALEKRDKSRIIRAIRNNGIALNARGNINTEDLKDKLHNIYEENTGKNAAKVGAGGVIGGAVGLLTGINPLLAAAAGAGISILNNSDTLKNIIFGKEINENGDREGGIISKKIYDIFKKAAPDMTDFGIAGGLLGLFTPFGPLGGAAIGAGIGYLKNSESFKKFIFGDEATGKDGFIKKESYDKFMATVKKAVPNMLIGAGAGILAGPFGLLGNAAMGAGLGLLTSTDSFNKFLFGENNQGGITAAFKNGILDPAKEHILNILTDFKDYAKKNIFEPLKNFWNPMTQSLKNIIHNTFDSIKDHINDMFERTVGLPMADFLQEKVFRPITNTLFKIIKAPINIGKAIVAAPFRALGGIGNSIRAGQIRRGTAYDMSASERLAYRDNHNIRFGRFNSWRDKSREQDEMLANMSIEDLEALSTQTNIGLSSMAELQNRAGNAREAIGKDISSFFNDKDSNGNIRYRKVNYNLVKELSKVATDGNLDEAYNIIDNFMNDLSDDEKKSLKEKLKDKIAAADKANNDVALARKGTAAADTEISKLIGRKVNGRKDRRQIYKSAEAEIRARKKGIIKEEESPEEHATNNLSSLYDERSNKLINLLTATNKFLETMVNPEAAKNDKRPPSDVENEAKRQSSSTQSISTPSTDSSEQPTAAADAAKKVSMFGRAKNFARNIFDQVTGRFISNNPDAKENVENEAARKEKERNDQENTEANKKTNTLISRLVSGMFGNGKNDKDKNSGILSKIFNGGSKILKFLGIGGSTLVGGSLFGHASEWFKKSVWPKLTEALPAFKKILLGEDGNSGVMGWLKEKCFDPISGFFSKVKKWWDDNGGLTGIIGNVVLPKMVSGWGLAMNNILTPLIALVLKHLPSMLASLGKAIWNGITMAVFDKKIDRSASHTIESSTALSEYAETSAKVNSNLSSNLDSSVTGLFDTSSTAYTPSNNATINFDKILDSNYADANETYSYDGQNLNKSSSDIMYTDGLLGAKHSTNQLYYNENGNIAIGSYDKWNTTDSIASKVAGTAGKGFVRALLGAKPGAALFGKLAGMSGKGYGKGLFKFGTGILKKSAKATGSVINGGISAGTKINDLINQALSSSTDDVVDAGVNAAGDIIEAGTKSADDIVEAAAKSVDDIIEAGAKSMDNIAGSAAKNIANVAGDVVEVGANATDNIAGAASKLVDNAVEAGSKVVDDVIEAGVKASDNVVGKVVENAAKSAANNPEGIVGGIVKIFKDIADSKIGGLLMKACSAGTTKAMLDNAIEKLAKKLGDNIVGKVAKKALGKVASAISKFSPITIIFWITDFLWGIDNADTILGVAKGDSYQINFGQKCLCGLLNMINNQLTLGLIPTDVIVDIVIEFLFPIFGIDASALNAARDRADEIMDQWNKEHPDDTYTNLEDFNNKDKWTTKAGKAIKNWAGNVWEDVKEGWQKTKENTTIVWNAAKTVGTNVGAAIFNSIQNAWHPDEEPRDEELKSTGNELLDNISNTIFNIANVLTTPVKWLGKGVNKIKKSATAFIESTKSIGTVVATAINNKIENAWHPDEEPKDEELKSTGNETLDNIAQVIFKIGDILTTPNRLLGHGINTVKNAITGFVESAKSVGTVVTTAINNKIENAWNPDKEPKDEKLKSTGNETLDNIANVAYNIGNIFTTPNQLLGKAVNAVKKGMQNMFNKYKTAQNTKKSDDAKIEKALNGEISVFSSDYWSNASHDGEGIFGTIVNVQTYIEKILNAPIVIVKGICTKISDAFTSIKDWFGDTFGSIWSWVTGFFSDDDKPSESSTENVDNTESTSNTTTVNTNSNTTTTGRGRKTGIGHLWQSNKEISKMKYGNSTIGEAGCAPVAAANMINSIASGAGSVNDAASYAENNSMIGPDGGTDVRYFNSYLASKGISTQNTTNRNDVINALRSGNQVVMLGKDNDDRPGAPFGSIPHYVTAKAITPSGNIIVEDPDLPNNNITYNSNDVMKSMITSVIANTNNIVPRERRKIKNSKMNRQTKNMSSYIYKKPKTSNTKKSTKNKIRTGKGRMLGPQAILNVARSQIGVSEGPRPNQVKYNDAYWGKGAYPTNSQSDSQWCVVFVWWVFNQAGASKLFYGGNKIAYVGRLGGLNGYYAGKGKYDKENPMPGDIAIIDWDEDGDPDHAAIVELVDGDRIRIIDGNANIDASGQRVPGCVANRYVSMNEIHGFCHIDYPYEYDESSVVDMSQFGDNTDYEEIARNGGSMDGSTGDSSDSSTGNTLLDRIANFGKSIVKRLFGENAYNALFGSSDTADPNDSSGVNGGGFYGSTDGHKIWNYLKSKGYNDNGIAGIMGNLYAESGLLSNNLQNEYESSLGDDETYTSRVNSRTYGKNSFTNDEAGYGLAQWTWWEKKKQLYEATIEANKKVNDLRAQIDFLADDLENNYPDMATLIKNASSYQLATNEFLNKYERPAVKNYDQRQQYAKLMMDMYSDSDTYSGVDEGYTSLDDVGKQNGVSFDGDGNVLDYKNTWYNNSKQEMRANNRNNSNRSVEYDPVKDNKREYLLSQGIDPDKIEYESYGETFYYTDGDHVITIPDNLVPEEILKKYKGDYYKWKHTDSKSSTTLMHKTTPQRSVSEVIGTNASQYGWGRRTINYGNGRNCTNYGKGRLITNYNTALNMLKTGNNGNSTSTGGYATKALNSMSNISGSYGDAVKALNSVSGYSNSTSDTNINVKNYNNSTSVNYNTFLQTIVEILMTIANNTALLNKILEILSDKFDLNINKDEIASATSKSRAQTEHVLNNLIRSRSDNEGISKILNNKDNQYLLNAMAAIASE